MSLSYQISNLAWSSAALYVYQGHNTEAILELG